MLEGLRPSKAPPLVDGPNPSQFPFVKGRGPSLRFLQDGLLASFVVPMATDMLDCEERADGTSAQATWQSMDVEVRLRATARSGARFARKDVGIRLSSQHPCESGLTD